MLIIIALLTFFMFIFNLGIFIPAKRYGVKVEKFYIWFDYRFQLFRFKIGETEYGMGWIPLGGYVKLSGMLLEEGKEIQPWHFKNLNPLRQVIATVMGPIVCVICAALFYGVWSSFPGGFLITTLVFIGGFLAWLFLIRQLTGQTKHSELSQSFNGGHFFMSLLLYGVLLVGCCAYLYFSTPFFDDLFALVDGKVKWATTVVDQSNWLHYAAAIGGLMGIANILPFAGLNGQQILNAIYLGLSGGDIPEKAGNRLTIFTFPLVLATYGYLGYCFFF